MVERKKILEAVRTAIESAPERKFSESVDLTVNLKNIDMAQPKNRIDETISLPRGTGRPIRIAVKQSASTPGCAASPAPRPASSSRASRS